MGRFSGRTSFSGQTRGGGGRSRAPVSTTVTRNPDGSRTIVTKDFRTGKVIGTVSKDSGGRTIPTPTPRTPLSVKTTISGNRTRVVTRGGKVTIRDSRGRIIETFRTPVREAQKFLRKTGAEIKRQVVKKRVIGISIGKDPRVEALEKLGVTKAKQVFELSKQGRLSFRGRTLIITEVEKVAKKLFGGVAIKAEEKTALLKDIKKALLKGDPAGLRKKIAELRSKQLSRAERAGPVGRIVKGTLILGGIGALRGITEVFNALRRPDRFIINQIKAITKPRETIRIIGQEFSLDPAGTIVEFLVFAKTLNLGTRLIKRSPVGRFVQEELFIRGQPIEIRPFVRKIIKGAKIQERINPSRIKSIKKVDFFEVKSLTKTEAKALLKTVVKTDSVVFGSAAARTLSKSKTPLPKDVDIATRNIRQFNQVFVNNLPKSIRNNYLVVGQKLVRRSNRQALFDIKPLNRLVPQRSFLGRGRLPVVGFVKRLGRRKKSILPTIKRKKVTGALEVPTQKIVKVKGVRLVGFGEQTTRKALGTLQVLIEKNVRRAKDPQSFLISLRVQLGSLKKIKPKTPIGRLSVNRRIRVLRDAIKVLSSSEFARLLERRVPGITKRFPILKKLVPIKVKRINKAFVNKRVNNINNRVNNIRQQVNVLDKKRVKTNIDKKNLNVLKKELRTFTNPSRLPPSRLPRSIIPSRLPKTSRLPPSKLPSKLPSRLPSKIPVSSVLKSPSKIPGIGKSIIPISKIPKSILPPSRLPPSRLPPIRPPSRLPPSKLPPIRPPRRFPPKKPPKIPERKKKEEIIRLVDKNIKERNFIFIPDLWSVLFGIQASLTEKRFFLKSKRLFTGFERRKIVRRK